MVKFIVQSYYDALRGSNNKFFPWKIDGMENSDRSCRFCLGLLWEKSKQLIS